MRDFWRSSGFHLLERDDTGQLVVTDGFLRAYLARPEMCPVEESCAAERALHASLSEEPRAAVPRQRLAALADADARENYAVFLDFRDRLVEAGTLERCYVSLFADEAVRVPPLFVDQLVHAILRNVLDGVDEPLKLRAGELLFRPQRVMLQDGTVLVADAEVVEMYATTGGFGSFGRLLAQAQTPMRSVELDVLTEDNAEMYWERDERYDMALNTTFGQPGLDALCRVLEAWVRHFLGASTRLQPVQMIRDERWVWHVGLDAEASTILNDLYHGTAVDEARLERILALFRLEFDDPSLMIPSIAGRPVYLAMAATPEGVLRLKPQNLLVNLPLAPSA